MLHPLRVDVRLLQHLRVDPGEHLEDALQRAKALHLTPAAYPLVNRAVQIVEEVDREFFSALEDRLPQMVGLMQQLLDRE